MNVEIAELSDVHDLRELAELFAVVWARPGEPPISSDVLKALALSGNYVAGVSVDRRLKGGLVGWLGGVPPDSLLMHSHILGVVPDTQARGLGCELKQHQRRWCLARGVKVMEWTTDPLISRNVYFNLTKLGARALEYLVDFYGDMGDGINAGDESDRFLIRWQLDSPEAEAAATGRASEPDVDALKGGGAAVVLEVGATGGPEIMRSRSRVLLCQVPDDIVALRSSNPALAREWRLAVRRALGGSLEKNYAITGATRSGWYVLENQ